MHPPARTKIATTALGNPAPCPHPRVIIETRTTHSGFGNSKKKKKKKAQEKQQQQKSDDPGGNDRGDHGEGAGEELARWDAEAEAPVLWWWETDDAARVPWGVARLLGLLLRCVFC